eukprot:4582796-Heterocapsa_arctica.AAC.1
MESQSRDRDHLPTLPNIPWDEAVRQCAGHPHAAVRTIVTRANDTISRLRALSCNEVTPSSTPTTTTWAEARAAQREVALSVLLR